MMHSLLGTPTEVFADRLRHSRNPIERRSLFMGRSLHQGLPVLWDTNGLVQHGHIVGPPGSGKTSLGINTIARQLMAIGDGPLIIFDGKGDMGLFNSVRHWAHVLGREFKWFTNRPLHSTYVFNPWDNRLIKRLTLPDLLGHFTQSLNLHHGTEYARAFFGMQARDQLRQAILETVPDVATRSIVSTTGKRQLFPKHGPVQSFRDLLSILKDRISNADELRAAQHLAMIVEALCDFDQLNLAPNTKPGHPAVSEAIFMPEVIEKKQVVYFYLTGALDNVSVAEIARLAIYSLYTAAVHYCEQHGFPARIYTIWDEAQIMISKNIEYVLTQSRSHGMSCLLAHQAMGQLNPPGGIDLRDLVIQCTMFKLIFGARDPWFLDHIVRTSGSTKYYGQGYDVAAADALKGRVGLAATCRDRDGEQRVRIQEYIGPRLTYQDVLDVSTHPNLSLCSVGIPTPLCPFRGWFPMHTQWPVHMSTQQHYERYPWPKKTPATIETQPLWKEDEPASRDDSAKTAVSQGDSSANDALNTVWQNVTGSKTKKTN
ncbi:MAG: type IV secretory system conjugative DNA transfer family protein [Pirellulaceae bacterium]